MHLTLVLGESLLHHCSLTSVQIVEQERQDFALQASSTLERFRTSSGEPRCLLMLVGFLEASCLYRPVHLPTVQVFDDSQL